MKPYCSFEVLDIRAVVSRKDECFAPCVVKKLPLREIPFEVGGQCVRMLLSCILHLMRCERTRDDLRTTFALCVCSVYIAQVDNIGVNPSCMRVQKQARRNNSNIFAGWTEVCGHRIFCHKTELLASHLG